jgi:hypothetical protein
LRADSRLALGEHQPIRLSACDVARGPDSPAAQFARESGHPVTAPTERMWSDRQGNEHIASAVLKDGRWVPKHPPDGQWRTFEATGSEHIAEPPREEGGHADVSDPHPRDARIKAAEEAPHASQTPHDHGTTSPDHTAEEHAAGEQELAGRAEAADMAVERYEQLGDEPPEFNVASNDAEHAADNAHTIDRHGPQIPLERDPNTRTVEGRIYGDSPWPKAETWSYKWTDVSTMNRTINEYVRQNWEAIRSDLAIDGFHSGSFDAGHLVGQGYYNRAMYTSGQRQAQFGETSFVQARIQVVPGSNPPEPFILTAFPSGLL